MRIPIFASGILFGLAVLRVAGGAAQTDSSGVQLYKLEPASSFETGCFGPCVCAVISRSLRGTFDLQHAGFDPLFNYYKVSNVQWTVSDATSNLTVRGSGTYKVGGEFAIQQQLSLDLSVGGDAPQHFDSGLVLGGGEFPKISIDISLHQNTACIDTVMHVEATDPVVTSVETGSDPTRAFWVQAAPNPFHGQTEIRLAVGSPGSLDVRIYDIQGRTVRHLARGVSVPAGLHVLTWDGRCDQGSVCATGVYFLGARVSANRTMSRIVKLE